MGKGLQNRQRTNTLPGSKYPVRTEQTREVSTVRSKGLTWTLVMSIGLVLMAGAPDALAKKGKGKKKLSLAELAALEWKLEQGAKSVTKSADPEARKKAVAELASLADPRATAPLALCLKEDPDPSVRLKAAEALAAFNSPEALGVLQVSAAADPDPAVREACAALLKKFKKRMKPAALALKPIRFREPKEKVTAKLLQKTLASPSGDARLWAIKQLGTSKAKERDAWLQTHLDKDPSSRVRVESARLLATLQQKKSIPSLIKAAGDGDPAVRFEVARILAEFDDSGALAVLQKLAADDKNDTVKAEAKDLLEPSTVIGKKLLSERITKLTSPNPAERITALQSLQGFTHWRAMVPMACTLLGDKSALVRQAAGKIVPDMHDVSVQIALRVAAFLEEDKKLKASVRKTLAGLVKKVNGLIKQLDSKEAGQRVLAARALGQGAYPPALEPLIKALKDPDPRVRLAAAEGLQNFSNDKAATALQVAGADKDAKVRASIDRFFTTQRRLASYRKIYKDPNRIVMWTMDKKKAWKRADAAVALGIAGAERSEGNLAKLLLHDKSEKVRLAAAWALVLMASDRAENALKMAAKDDPSKTVQMAARKFLIIHKVSREDLITQLQDEDESVRRDAAEGLSLMANKSVLNPLIRAAMCDKAPAVRSSSLRGLARIGNPLAKMVIKILMIRDPDKAVKRTAMVMNILAGG